MSSTHLVEGHTLTLLRNGEEYFPRLIAAIDGAVHSIYLETYIYAADSTGRKVADALLRAAQRDVAIHLLLDGYGSADLPQPWIDEMRAAGIVLLWFRKGMWRFSLRRYHLRRLHRKLVLIDERIAFVSGINIINDVPGGEITAPRLDYAIEIQGAAVERIYVSMRRLWMVVSWMSFRRQREHVRMRPEQVQAEHHHVIFLVRDNLRHRRDIEHAYLKAIVASRREIIIANAYFLPGLRLRRALLDAARRGVNVILLLQGKVEYHLQHYATLALYDELLKGGVKIYEYHISFMHAKVAVVDGYWATVGSSNIDPFSLWLAREANIEVRDAGFAGSLRASLLHEIEHGTHSVTHSTWRKQGLWTCLLMRASYAVVRFLTGVTGYMRSLDDV